MAQGAEVARGLPLEDASSPPAPRSWESVLTEGATACSPPAAGDASWAVVSAICSASPAAIPSAVACWMNWRRVTSPRLSAV